MRGRKPDHPQHRWEMSSQRLAAIHKENGRKLLERGAKPMAVVPMPDLEAFWLDTTVRPAINALEGLDRLVGICVDGFILPAGMVYGEVMVRMKFSAVDTKEALCQLIREGKLTEVRRRLYRKNPPDLWGLDALSVKESNSYAVDATGTALSGGNCISPGINTGTVRSVAHFVQSGTPAQGWEHGWERRSEIARKGEPKRARIRARKAEKREAKGARLREAAERRLEKIRSPNSD